MIYKDKESKSEKKNGRGGGEGWGGGARINDFLQRIQIKKKLGGGGGKGSRLSEFLLLRIQV